MISLSIPAPIPPADESLSSRGRTKGTGEVERAQWLSLKGSRLRGLTVSQGCPLGSLDETQQHQMIKEMISGERLERKGGKEENRREGGRVGSRLINRKDSIVVHQHFGDIYSWSSRTSKPHPKIENQPFCQLFKSKGKKTNERPSHLLPPSPPPLPSPPLSCYILTS